MPQPRCSYFADARPAALVVSHPRSGTHFLMNALATCYGYVSSPWISLDPINIPVNYWAPTELVEFLLPLTARPLANVTKSHHAVEFFASELPRLTERYAVFYVYRDPVETLLSFWRFVHRWEWVGPKVADPLTFARSEPCEGMLRYLKRQHTNVMTHWAAHIEGWVDAAQRVPRVTLVRYEDLNTRFAETLGGFAAVLGRPPQALVRPEPGVNVIPGGPEDPTGLGIPPDVEALRALCRETVGDTMARLGY